MLVRSSGRLSVICVCHLKLNCLWCLPIALQLQPQRTALYLFFAESTLALFFAANVFKVGAHHTNKPQSFCLFDCYHASLAPKKFWSIETALTHIETLLCVAARAIFLPSRSLTFIFAVAQHTAICKVSHICLHCLRSWQCREWSVRSPLNSHPAAALAPPFCYNSFFQQSALLDKTNLEATSFAACNENQLSSHSNLFCMLWLRHNKFRVLCLKNKAFVHRWY